MNDLLLLSLFAGIAVLLVLILLFRIHAFISLLIASITTGLIAGLEPAGVLESIKNGMAGTLGYVATVVGLGAVFGGILEHTGGALSLSRSLLKTSGERKAPWALVIAGFIIAIPVFFDIAFIILVPLLYSLRKTTGKSVLLFGIPLLAGLAVTHGFIPPTPGPVAVADLIDANLGFVMIAGLLAGIPAAIIAGPLWGRFIAGKINPVPPDYSEEQADTSKLPSATGIFMIIALPLTLIIMDSFLEQKWINFLGHPFTALITANLTAWYFLGIRRGYKAEELLKISGSSLTPAGVIILVTGAGGVFKQVLQDTGSGEVLSQHILTWGATPVVFSFAAALLFRVVQGSATVAMITSATLTAPLLLDVSISELQKAFIVIAIASGATAFSHVNDSGFWLVSRYLGMDMKETFRSWTLMTVIIGLTGFAVALAGSMVF